MKLRDEINEHGTPVTVFLCEYCEREFTVCPAVPDINLDNWQGCTAPDCSSYDEERDIDKQIEEGGVTLMKEETRH